jgi:hypothetical protein
MPLNLTITDAASAAAKRAQATAYVFPGGWPTAMPTVGSEASPIANVPVAFSTLNHAGRKVGLWTPASPNGTLLIVVQGHATSLDQIGVGNTVRQAAAGGITVLAMAMQGSPTWAVEDHANDSLASFVMPLAVALNHVGPANYQRVVMTGISGGGWTTTLYAALDSRITTSIPIAGSYPLFVRQAADMGDYEQGALPGSEPFWASVCSYEDAYALGASNGEQLQVLNPTDSCCFHGDGRQNQYAPQVASVAAALGGAFGVYLDNTIPNQHAISQHVIDNIILPRCGLMSIQIIDSNIGPGFALVGAEGTPNVGGQNNVWTRWTSDANAYANSCYTTNAGGGIREAVYSFAVTPGLYKIAAKWPHHANRGTNIKHTINGQVVLVNQELAPNDFQASGYGWKVLIASCEVTGNAIEVRISNEGANEYVVADAIRVERVGDLASPPATKQDYLDAFASDPFTAMDLLAEIAPTIPAAQGWLDNQ